MPGTNDDLNGNVKREQNAVNREIFRDTLLTQLLNGIFAVVFVSIALWVVASPERRTNPAFIFWYVPAVALLHTLEEYVWPGGFVRWFNTIAFGSTDPNSPLSARRALMTDGAAALAIVPAMFFFGRSTPMLVLVFASLLMINAFFHLCEVFKTGVYSPGAGTALVLYLPVLSWVGYFYVSNDFVSPIQLTIAFSIGVGFTIIFFWLVRRWQRQDRTESLQTDVILKTA